MAWLILFVAGLCEIGWAVGLKYTEGFTRPWPTVLTGVSLIASMALLGMAVKSLPLGTAYAVWTGIGAVGTVILGIVLFKEPVTVARLVSVGLILAGIEQQKSAGPAAIVRGLGTVRPEGVPGYFRDWDHQFITRLVVTQVKDVVTDKYDALRIINKPMTLAEYEPLYGTREEIGCSLGSA